LDLKFSSARTSCCSFDFILDMLPLRGFADDATVTATAIRLVAVHIGLQHREAARRLLARATAP
jgi:uncharacterized membrane protein YkvA (DUF1232 family)